VNFRQLVGVQVAFFPRFALEAELGRALAAPLISPDRRQLQEIPAQNQLDTPEGFVV